MITRKVDSNQREIVINLRAAGASVAHLHTLGKGVPDLLVGWRGSNFLLEVKSPNGQLTKSEKDFCEHWHGQVAVVKTWEEALLVIDKGWG